MSILVPSLENVDQIAGRRAPQRRAIRGKIRTAIRKTLEKLQVLRNYDDREAGRAAMLGYNPTLIKKANNSKEDRAISTVMERLQELLDLQR